MSPVDGCENAAHVPANRVRRARLLSTAQITGQKLRLRGKGSPPAKASDQPGHQYVVIKIVSPAKLDPKAKQLLEEFRQVCDYKPDRFK